MIPISMKSFTQIAKLMAPVSGVQALGRGYYVLETLCPVNLWAMVIR